MPANPYNKYIKQYQANNVNTASPERIMLMLLDATIQFLLKAKNAIIEKKLEERAENINGARRIIRELMRTIDIENGNDVARNLFRFYNSTIMKLLKIEVQKNTKLLDEVIADISNIRWGFDKAIKIESGLDTVDNAMKEYIALGEQDNQSNVTNTDKEDNNAG